MTKNILKVIMWITSIVLSVGITFFITKDYYDDSETRGLIEMFGKERYRMLTNIDKQITTKYYFKDGEIIIDETESQKTIEVP
ncbi:MAG: hypothetical protein ACRCTE_10530 [Cellulosilyticaceae bacterium]